jgi:hypothetical protein
MLNIGKFIARIRRRIFTERIEWEIYHKLFPHLQREADHGYPFLSDADLIEQNTQGLLRVQELCLDLEAAAAKMPAAYGQAFRHLAYEDINSRLAMYVRLAKQREYHGIGATVPKPVTA